MSLCEARPHKSHAIDSGCPAADFDTETDATLLQDRTYLTNEIPCSRDMFVRRMGLADAESNRKLIIQSRMGDIQLTRGV